MNRKEEGTLFWCCLLASSRALLMKLAMRWQRGSEMLRLKDSMLTSKDSNPKLRLLLMDELIRLIDFSMDYS